MSLDKSKLHELIDLLSDEDINDVVIILKDYVEKKNQDNLFLDLLNNPIKVNEIKKFSRDDLYER